MHQLMIVDDSNGHGFSKISKTSDICSSLHNITDFIIM